MLVRRLVGRCCEVRLDAAVEAGRRLRRAGSRPAQKLSHGSGKAGAGERPGGARRMPLFGIRVAPNFGHGPTDLFGFFLPESGQVFLPRFRARKRYRFPVPVGAFCECYA